MTTKPSKIRKLASKIASWHHNLEAPGGRENLADKTEIIDGSIQIALWMTGGTLAGAVVGAISVLNGGYFWTLPPAAIVGMLLGLSIQLKLQLPSVALISVSSALAGCAGFAAIADVFDRSHFGFLEGTVPGTTGLDIRIPVALLAVTNILALTAATTAATIATARWGLHKYTQHRQTSKTAARPVS